MNRVFLGLAATALLAGAAPASAAHICLDVQNMQGNYSPDARTIIFHMRDGSIWRNTLPRPCPGLRFNGFIWVLRGTTHVCGEQQTIRVIHSGEICFLGKFHREKAPKG